MTKSTSSNKKMAYMGGKKITQADMVKPKMGGMKMQKKLIIMKPMGGMRSSMPKSAKTASTKYGGSKGKKSC